MLTRCKSLGKILTFNVAIGAVAFMATAANAGPGKSGHGHGHESRQEARGGHGSHMNGAGMPGDKAKVSRTVLIIARDNEFSPKKVEVVSGETVRFVIRNEGEILHEFTIGTPEMQKSHQDEMMKMMEEGHFNVTKKGPDMHHSHGNSAMVEPGKQAEVIWKFQKAAAMEFGCNIPGHYQMGMKGDFVLSSGV